MNTDQLPHYASAFFFIDKYGQQALSHTRKLCRLFKKIIPVFILAFLPGCKKEFAEVISSSNIRTETMLATSTRPNILLILADDIGYEVPTVNGGGSYATPNIDKLARSGMRFTQCYASPMCSPSRFMLLTGKYNFRNYYQWGVMDLTQRTFANMLGDAGYDTYVIGKWQLDGGDQSVRTFGFNRSYTIFEQYENRSLNRDNDPVTTGRYKSPELYANGANFASGTAVNKYCDDILADSVITAAKRSVKNNKPFFIYYPMSLCHQPFSPTPDDPEYALWDPASEGDAIFFPSMVKYMDKKLGLILKRFDNAGLMENTMIIFIGDNGTPPKITSLFNGQTVQGGKMKSTVWGTHVPLIIAWKNVVKPGRVNRDLIDFTDFLPTLAGIANVPVPFTYGPIDGVSFYPRLTGQKGTPRKWIFCHYDPDNVNPTELKRWIQDTTYKLYDSIGTFYNTVLDPYELNNLHDSVLTTKEKQRKIFLQSEMDKLHN